MLTENAIGSKFRRFDAIHRWVSCLEAAKVPYVGGLYPKELESRLAMREGFFLDGGFS
jgi:hypothetical protein